MTQFNGDLAKIIDVNHPHYEALAICKGIEKVSGEYAMRFKREDSKEEFFVFNGKQIKWL